VGNVLEEGEKFGSSGLFHDQKIIIEYTNTNVLKPMHIGHLMGNVIGQSLSNVFEASGAEIKRNTYQGDVGLHIAKAVWGIIRSGGIIDGSLSEKVDYVGKCYALGANAYEDEPTAAEEIKEINKKVFEKSDEKLSEIYAWARQVSLDHFEDLYKYLNTKFDYYFFESEVSNSAVAIIKEYLQKGVFEESVLVLTKGGYIKRTNPDEYRQQKRGGVGVVDLDTKEEDFITHLVYANAHNDLLFFTDKGKAYQIKMYDLPEGKRATRGKSVMNFLSLSEGEKITSILPMPKNKKEADGLALMMVTKNGTGKKSSAMHFHDVRRSGLIAITLEEKDELISASFVSKSDTVVIATQDGQSIRFEAEDVREMGRNATGVRVIKLGKDDAVISADVVAKDAKNPKLFVMGENGYGKQTKLDEYKVQNRGGSGILTMNVTEKTGPLIAAKVVTEDIKEMVAMSKKSQVIRVDLNEIPTLGRSTQGVRVMKLRDGDSLASLICL
jgi:DNA gyrase/topoisomerase IV subunit A